MISSVNSMDSDISIIPFYLAGGLYVARRHRDVAMIAGITLACVFVLVVVIGTIIYYRRKPDAWARARGRFRNLTRSLKTEV